MDVFEESATYLMNTYKRYPVCFQKGKGVYLWDTQGKKYLDFLAGIAVNTLGHAHPALVGAITQQAKQLIHVSNLYHIQQQAKLAAMLAKNSCFDKAFFCNSGAEANETAIKLARLHRPGAYRIISLENSFHGRTLASLAMTGQRKYREPFEPMPDGFTYAKANDLDDVASKIDKQTCAVIVEFIQGEGGIIPLEEEFVHGLRELCDEHDLLLIADEIQTGLGRSGKLFAYEHYGIEPDLATLAKGLAGGVPIGVLLAKKAIADKFEPGMHGSTFGGNPLACSAAIAVLETIMNENLVEHARTVGDYLKERLMNIKSNRVKRISGMGLMIGIELTEPQDADDLIKKALENGILIGKAGNATVRIEPPLIVEKREIDTLIEFLENSLT